MSCREIAAEIEHSLDFLTTSLRNMPERHRKQHQWSPGRLKNWAKDIGPHALYWVSTQLESRQHPEQAYRVCLGLLNLSRQYPAYRLERACQIARQQQLWKLKQVKSLLQANLDRLPEHMDANNTLLPQDHENIRGPESFH